MLRTVGVAEAGQSVCLAIGGRLHVELEENPTTGYQWHVEEIDRNLLRLEESTLQFDGPVNAGRAGTRRFDLVAIASGSCRLCLANYRSWESAATTKQTITYAVIVE